MRRDEALVVMGLTGDPTNQELRRVYRELLRRHHPDVAGPSAQATTVRIIQAYQLLAAGPAAEPAGNRPAPPAPREQAPAPNTRSGPAGSPPAGEDGDTVRLHLPPDEAFLLLLDVAHRYGEVTYIDRETGLFETVLEFEGHGPCSLVATLQGRATGVTEAFLCCEPLIVSRPPPPLPDIAEWLRQVVAERSATA